MGLSIVERLVLQAGVANQDIMLVGEQKVVEVETMEFVGVERYTNTEFRW
jgi:hypothetical protein